MREEQIVKSNHTENFELKGVENDFIAMSRGSNAGIPRPSNTIYERDAPFPYYFDGSTLLLIVLCKKGLYIANLLHILLCHYYSLVSIHYHPTLIIKTQNLIRPVQNNPLTRSQPLRITIPLL